MAKKILIIEDEKPLARVLEIKLVQAGFEVKIAHDGEKAIFLLNSEEFSFILLDLMLPKFNGFQVLEFIKTGKITTPVMVLTNINQKAEEARVKELGAIAFFVKTDTPIIKVVEYVKEKLAD